MRYELGILGTVGTTATAQAEVRAGAAKPMSLLEFGIFLNAATASLFTLGRPGNTPAGGTAQTATLPVSQPSGGAASLGGIILSGWTTAPTVSAAGHTTRSLSLPAAIGNGIVFTWQMGEMMISPTTTTGFILWNAGTNSVARIYAKWDE